MPSRLACSAASAGDLAHVSAVLSERFAAQTATVSVAWHDSGSLVTSSSSANQGFSGRTNGAGTETAGGESLNGSASSETTRTVRRLRNRRTGRSRDRGCPRLVGCAVDTGRKRSGWVVRRFYRLFLRYLPGILKTARLSGQRHTRAQIGHRSSSSPSPDLRLRRLMIHPGEQCQDDAKCRAEPDSRGKSDHSSIEPVSRSATGPTP